MVDFHVKMLNVQIYVYKFIDWGQKVTFDAPSSVRLNSHQMSTLLLSHQIRAEWHQICCTNQATVAPIHSLIALIPIEYRRFAPNAIN